MLIRLMYLVASAICATTFSDRASPQAYPSRPIRLVVPSVPGGAFDTVSRALSERLTAALGQQVIVDNRSGAQGSIALDAVAKAAADGYTIAVATDSTTILSSLYRNVSFDPQASFAPIILMTTQPLVLAVHGAVPAANFKELVALSKANPGSLSFGSGGAQQHLTGELI
jgi:tripartite-type tricarboxylate transporter receptor subunit TctC